VTILAIVNLFAGRHAAARIWAHLQSHTDLTRAWACAMTEYPGHARELAADAARRGVTRVVAVGGDGTVNEVAGGLVHSQTVLAMIPAGTGNDVAKNLGIPSNPVAAAALAQTGAERSLDVGEVQTSDRLAYFLNVAGFGFDAEVAWRVNRIPKLLGGTLPYLAGVLQTLWRYTSPPMRLEIDGQPIDRRVFLVAVANCHSYGGGMQIAPRARPDDGLFDVCVVKDLGKLEVLRVVPRIYSGGHVGHPAVVMFRCRAVTAVATGRVLCHADGELAGALPARFRVLPAALRCVTGPAS
jgi:YegS/Rv2252/BmrU family lipid kinase